MDLTKSELEIIEVLWNANRPLTGTEIVQLSPKDKSWKDSSIHILINSLLKKNAIKESGFVKTGKSYGRTFTATDRCEEYYVEYLASIVKRTSLKKLFAALFDNSKMSEENIFELEELLKKYKGEVK